MVASVATVHQTANPAYSSAGSDRAAIAIIATVPTPVAASPAETVTVLPASCRRAVRTPSGPVVMRAGYRPAHVVESAGHHHRDLEEPHALQPRPDVLVGAARAGHRAHRLQGHLADHLAERPRRRGARPVAARRPGRAAAVGPGRTVRDRGDP